MKSTCQIVDDETTTRSESLDTTILPTMTPASTASENYNLLQNNDTLHAINFVDFSTHTIFNKEIINIYVMPTSVPVLVSIIFVLITIVVCMSIVMIVVCIVCYLLITGIIHYIN